MGCISVVKIFSKVLTCTLYDLNSYFIPYLMLSVIQLSVAGLFFFSALPSSLQLYSAIYLFLDIGLNLGLDLL